MQRKEPRSIEEILNALTPELQTSGIDHGIIMLDDDRSPLAALPPEILAWHVGKHLPASDKLRLASDIKNKWLFSIFNQEIRPARQLVREFLLYVVYGNFMQAEAMLQKDPGLLLEKATIRDYSGRLIQGAALQIALGAGDVSLGTPCELISVAMLPTSGNLGSIKIAKKTAYVCYEDRLFYIDKSNNNECTEIRLDEDELKHKVAVKQFHAEMRPQGITQTLSEDQLKRITELTGHIHEEGMAEMIERYLKQLPNGEAIIAAQILEQFPEGWEKREEERAARDLIALNKVITVIADSTDNAHCAAAVQTFLAGLKPEGITNTGNHSNNHLLDEALKLYDENFDRFDGLDSRKNNLFWCEVIGGIECFLPACDAQVLCQCPHYIVDRGEKLKRSLRFLNSSNGANTDFYPLGRNPHFRLGKEFAAGVGVLWGHQAQGATVAAVVGASKFFRKYVTQKTSRLRGLIQQQQQPQNNSEKSRQCALI